MICPRVRRNAEVTVVCLVAIDSITFASAEYKIHVYMMDIHVLLDDSTAQSIGVINHDKAKPAATPTRESTDRRLAVPGAFILEPDQ